MTTLGDRLKQLREEKGLTQVQLGKIVNLSQQAIGHYDESIDAYAMRKDVPLLLVKFWVCERWGKVWGSLRLLCLK